MKEISYVPAKSRDFGMWNHGVFPAFRAAIRTGYLPLEIAGAENIPVREPVIYAANHSSWLALDGLLLLYAISQFVDREYCPYGIIHDVLLKLPLVGRFYKRCGTIPVSWVRDLSRLPEDIRSFGIF